MNEQHSESAIDRQDAEWCLLTSLCAPTLPATLRAEFCARLQGDDFADFAHRIVFQEICAMSKLGSARSARDLREHLPSRVTARGFPDLDFSDLLAGEELPNDEALPRLQRAYERMVGNK
jgi:hypothetical protein